MKKVFSLIILISFLGCNKSTSIEEYDRIDLNINLNLAIDFSLQLDPTAKSSSAFNNTTDSTFENVLDDQLTITFTSDPVGYSNSLTFDPADSEASISLPYGNYNWSISSSVESGTAISQKLPVYGSSSSTILINEPSVELDLVVQTDYSLITVNTDHVSSVTIEQGDESLELATKDGYFYAYLYSGAVSFTLQVTDTEGSSFSNTLDSVESCKEYKYTLSYSNVNVNSLVCLCEPFEVIERFLVPSSCTVEDVLTNGIVAWYPFNGNPNDESGNGNDGTNNGAVLAQDRNGENNKAYYFSGSGCSTRIDVNVDTSSIEINNSFSFSLWYRHNGNGCIGPRLLEFWPGGDIYGKFTVNTNKGSGNTFNPNIDYRSSEGRMGVRWNLEPNQWTHLVYTIDENEFKIYQNGVLYNTNQLYNDTDQTYYMNSGQTSGTIKLAQNGAFGRMNHSSWDAIDGYLDDIGIWNRVLTECEVEWLYEN